MIKRTPTERRLINEGRELLHAWALAEPEDRGNHAKAIAEHLRLIQALVPGSEGLKMFISTAVQSAVTSLATSGRAKEAGWLVDNLEVAAQLGGNRDSIEQLAQLRKDLAAYYTGRAEENDGMGFLAQCRAIFST